MITGVHEPRSSIPDNVMRTLTYGTIRDHNYNTANDRLELINRLFSKAARRWCTISCLPPRRCFKITNFAQRTRSRDQKTHTRCQKPPRSVFSLSESVVLDGWCTIGCLPLRRGSKINIFCKRSLFIVYTILELVCRVPGECPRTT